MWLPPFDIDLLWWPAIVVGCCDVFGVGSTMAAFAAASTVNGTTPCWTVAVSVLAVFRESWSTLSAMLLPLLLPLLLLPVSVRPRRPPETLSDSITDDGMAAPSIVTLVLTMPAVIFATSVFVFVAVDSG